MRVVRDRGERWTNEGLAFIVADNGPGLADPEAAFVPSYTTKPGGSAAGLTLARQIATAHGGRLDYQREGDRAVFALSIPLDGSA